MIIIIDFNFYQIVDCLENLKEKIQHVVPFLSIFIHSFIHFVFVVVLLSNYSHYMIVKFPCHIHLLAVISFIFPYTALVYRKFFFHFMSEYHRRVARKKINVITWFICFRERKIKRIIFEYWKKVLNAIIYVYACAYI